jgi:hypothetical protein
LWRAYPALDHALRPLDEFLTERLVAAATDNLVCRMLLGSDPRIPRTDFIASSDVDAVALGAIARLDTLGYVGVLELGDVMWHGLSRFFGVSLAPTRLNTTESYRDLADAPGAQASVTLDTLDALEARTAADTMVYRHLLSSRGYSVDDVERLRATAFAAELVRMGNVIGTSAIEARLRGQKSDAVARQLIAKEEERQFATARMHEALKELAEVKEQLRWHQVWLDSIQGSRSWRVTAPLRAGKRTLMRLPSLAMRAGGRGESPELDGSATTVRGQSRTS